MFGGIVESIGTIQIINQIDNTKEFIIAPDCEFDDLSIGDSIAVNGVCLTVTHFSKSEFHVTAVDETLKLTNLHKLTTNQTVNLERALNANQRIGGHYVQGHIDTVATIKSIDHVSQENINVTFTIDNVWMKYIVYKGFITIDGMSITITNTTPQSFSVTFIPHTINNTITKHYQLSDHVNIEVDILGKYIEKHIGAYLNDK